MINILCYGDSNTFGYDPHSGNRYDEAGRWPSRLQFLLGGEYNVIEDGLCGRTTCYDDPEIPNANAMKTIENDLRPYASIDMIVIMLGTNDLKVFTGADENDIASGVEQLMLKMKNLMVIKQIKEPLFLIVCPPEVGSGIRSSAFYGDFKENAISKSRKFPGVFRSMALKNGCRYFDASEWVKASEVDSIHLNVADHVIIADKLAEIIGSINKKVFLYK